MHKTKIAIKTRGKENKFGKHWQLNDVFYVNARPLNIKRQKFKCILKLVRRAEHK